MEQRKIGEWNALVSFDEVEGLHVITFDGEGGASISSTDLEEAERKFIEMMNLAVISNDLLKNNIREKLVKQLFSLREQQDNIREKINELDYTERIQEASKFIGRCFIEKEPHDETYVNCLYVYDVDKEDCRENALRILYYKNARNHFQIEHYYHFDNNEKGEYSEITKEEFMNHYNQVQKLISNTLNKKNGAKI